jgi:hypoxanthine-DNA glycosylase
VDPRSGSLSGDRGTPIRGLPPVWRRDAQVLVLGSMPSTQSLARQAYYGNPRNAFWRIMGALLGLDPASPYTDRLTALMDARVALWDVCGSCVREGSADAAIRDVEPNPIHELVARSPSLRAIALNGGKAHELFRRLLTVPVLGRAGDAAVLRLPSTSPAHASRSEADKLAEWRVLLDWLDERP